MLRNPNHVFWEALVITIFIFGVGILLGIFIEQGRAADMSDAFTRSQVDLLDIQLQSQLLLSENLSCGDAMQRNIEFGDRAYIDAQVLGRFEGASKLTQALIEQHRRFDLLRATFWLNSIRLKDRCKGAFHTVVYLYNYEPESIEEASEQKVFSLFLGELKSEFGNEIMLIPIAKNMDISAVDMLADMYGVTGTTIIVDEKFKFTSAESLPGIKEILK